MNSCKNEVQQLERSQQSYRTFGVKTKCSSCVELESAQWLISEGMGAQPPFSDLNPLQQYEPPDWICKVLFYTHITTNYM